MNPFAHRFDISSSIGKISESYPAKLEEGTNSPFRVIEEIIPSPTSEVSIAGRVMLHRSFGKICFATISDGTGRMQILFARENCSINVDGEIKDMLTSIDENTTNKVLKESVAMTLNNEAL